MENRSNSSVVFGWLFIGLLALAVIAFVYSNDYIFFDCSSGFDNNSRCDPVEDQNGNVIAPTDWFQVKVNVDNQKVLIIDRSIKDNSTVDEEYLSKCAIIDSNNWSCTDEEGFQYQMQKGHLIELGGPEYFTVARDSISGLAFFLYKVGGSGYQDARNVQQFFDLF